MRNAEKKFCTQNSHNWLSAVKFAETRRKLRLVPTNANLYHYAGNNPVKYTDPDGRMEMLRRELNKSFENFSGFKFLDDDSPKSTTPPIPDNSNGNESTSPSPIPEENNKDSPIDITPELSPTPDSNTTIMPQNDNSSKSNTLRSYIPAPDELPGIPDAFKQKRKTPVLGGSLLRKRWKDKDGNIYEWDYLHGELEKYDKHGKHLGSVDPKTGEQLKPAEKGRKVEP